MSATLKRIVSVTLNKYCPPYLVPLMYEEVPSDYSAMVDRQKYEQEQLSTTYSPEALGGNIVPSEVRLLPLGVAGRM